MKKLTLALLLLFGTPLSVYAEDALLTWGVPVQQETCTDGGALPNLAGFKIYELIADIANPSITSFVVPKLKPGTHIFVATAYNTLGEESRTSGGAAKVITKFVTLSPTVFFVIQQPDAFILLPIGTIPVGTACDPARSVNGFHGVPRDQVNWTGTAKPFSVVASCG